MSELVVREIRADEFSRAWPIFRAVIAGGDTYSYPPDISEPTAHAAWVEAPAATFVACDADGTVLGTYFIKPNQPGQGAHVCNCGYVTADAARGRGVAAAMCEHSQQHALALGFRAMQFNLVVSTNTGAVRLWQALGFAIVGTLPGAFRHSRLGFVDAHVMFKTLVPG